MELNTIKANVEMLLKDNPELRDKPNNYIVARYWKTFDNFNISPEVINNLTSAESIRRVKQKLVEQHPEKYSASEEVKEIKAGLDSYVRDWAIRK